MPWFKWCLITQSRWRLGLLAALLLAFWLLISGTDAVHRTANTFSPYWAPLDELSIALQVTPPAYTTQVPQKAILQGGNSLSLTVMAGSKLEVQVAGLDETVRLTPPEGEAILFRRKSSDQQVGQLKVSAAGTYKIKLGWRTLGQMKIKLQRDIPPHVMLTAPLSVTPAKMLHLPYKIEDDFGASNLTLVLEQAEEQRRLPQIHADLRGQNILLINLISDPWAGEPVHLWIEAQDRGGNIGQSQKMMLTLPERHFSVPLAQRIIALRKSLLRQPDEREKARRQLAILTESLPNFRGRFTVFLALRAAYWRLRYDREDPKAWSVAALLWDIALAVEEQVVRTRPNLRP